MAAMARHAGIAPAQYRSSAWAAGPLRLFSRMAGHKSNMPLTAASGTRFGRVRIAAPAARPDISAPVRPPRRIDPSESAHHAVTGTSLMGSSS